MTSTIAFLISFLVTPSIASWSRSRELVDTPNHRSSHSVPTPRLGGIGVACGLAGGLLASGADRHLYTLLLLAALIGAVGLADDLFGLSPLLRLSLQILAGVSLVIWTTSFFGASAWIFGIGAIWVASVINAYNFMDGLNGIASFQAIATLVAASAIIEFAPLRILCWAAVAALIGFVPWNIPRAVVFLGDSGSYLIGFICATATFFCALQTRNPLVAVFLFAPFLSDTGGTLLRRALRHERLFDAHRSHLYQRLNQTGWSHTSVSCTYGLLAAMFACAGWMLATWGWTSGTAAVSAGAVLGHLGIWRITVRREQTALA